MDRVRLALARVRYGALQLAWAQWHAIVRVTGRAVRRVAAALQRVRHGRVLTAWLRWQEYCRWMKDEQQRMARGSVKLVKADDAWMSADFLTKWISSAKLNKSVRYAINARA